MRQTRRIFDCAQRSATSTRAKARCSSVCSKLGMWALALVARKPWHGSAVLVLALAISGLGTGLWLTALLLIATQAGAGPGAHGPNGEHLDAPGPAVNASGLARLPDGSVNVPKTAQRRMAIRTVLAPESDAAATVERPGRVVMDPNASGRVQAVHGGRIEPGPKGLPVAGQAVRRGDVLAYVRHHAEPFALGAQQAQLAELKAQRQLAEQRFQRLESLEGTVPRKDIDAARTEASSLAERERSIGASLDIVSGPGEGTRVEVHVPAAVAYRPRTAWWRRRGSATRRAARGRCARTPRSRSTRARAASTRHMPH